jgi:hypothetical protein
MNCYKAFINEFCYRWVNWQGPSALFLDQCTFSNYALVRLYKTNPISNTLQTYIFGGSTVASASSGCVHVVSTMSAVQGQVWGMLFNYIEMYREEIG